MENPKNRTANELHHPQVDASHYAANYLSPKRMTSIAYQYQLALDSQGETYLEVGVGTNLLAFLLTKSGKKATSVDIDPDLGPDVLASLPHLPFSNGAFDTSLCFQVLEHLPFSLFIPSLLELSRVAEKEVIISLPDRTQTFSRKRRIANYFYQKTGLGSRWKIKTPQRNQQHFWEIGVDESVENILEVIAGAGLKAAEHFRNPHYQPHHFFVIQNA